MKEIFICSSTIIILGIWTKSTCISYWRIL